MGLTRLPTGPPVPDYLSACPPDDALGATPLAGVTAAIVSDAVGKGLSPGVRSAFERAVDHVASLGADITSISLPSFAAALPAYYVIALCEASSNLARYDGVRVGSRSPGAAAAADARALLASSRGAGFGPEVKRRILMGTYALSAGYVDAYYARAQRVRARVAAEARSALARRSDGGPTLLLMPAAPTVAPLLGDAEADPLAMYLGDIMTVTLNLAGLPGVCVPCGAAAADGDAAATLLPVGLQIVAAPHGEVDALRLAHAFERTAGFAALGRAPLAAL